MPAILNIGSYSRGAGAYTPTHTYTLKTNRRWIW